MPEWPAPPREAAYHGLAGRIVRAIEPHTEADPVAILVQLLVGYGSAIGRRAHFTVESDLHFGNLFAVQVGDSSKARKGTSWGRVRALFAEADPEWSRQCQLSGLSSGEGLINQVHDTEYDKNGGVLEANVKDKRRLVYEPEFSRVLKQARRETNILGDVLRESWDRGDLRSMTVKPRVATDAHISIIGHITRDELLRQLTETDAANGFGNRFLWYCARRARVLPRGGTQLDLRELGEELQQAIEHARGVRHPEMSRDHDAETRWEQVYPVLSEGEPGLLGAIIARAEAQVMRLAMLYGLLSESEVIARVHLEAALALWHYCERSARYIFGDSLGDPTADTILDALRGSREGLTRTEIRSDVLQRHTPSTEIARALASLEDKGLIGRTVAETGGRPVETVFATCAVSAVSAETPPNGAKGAYGANNPLPGEGEES